MAVLTEEKTLNLERVCEERAVFVAARPLTFEEFLACFGKNDRVELVNGTVVERMAAQIEHEQLFAWLFVLMYQYAEAKGLGAVLGSRTAVEISSHQGRLPDLLFVREERRDILRAKAVYGAPDLVIEIRSPGDRPSELIELEADYRSIGVPEIWLIDQQKGQVQVLRRGENEYAREIHVNGVVQSKAMQGFQVRAEWLLRADRPPVAQVLAELFNA